MRRNSPIPWRFRPCPVEVKLSIIHCGQGNLSQLLWLTYHQMWCPARAHVVVDLIARSTAGTDALDKSSQPLGEKMAYWARSSSGSGGANASLSGVHTRYRPVSSCTARITKGVQYADVQLVKQGALVTPPFELRTACHRTSVAHGEQLMRGRFRARSRYKHWQ